MTEDRTVVDITAPEGWDVEEVTEAKDEVYNLIWDWADRNFDMEPRDDGDETTLADDVVNFLVKRGWRPTLYEGDY